jgi:hypothetical protein
MPFDVILGMGKTPQITEDIAINPYSLYLDDVTGLIVPTATLDAGLTTEGSLINPLNPNFDYITNNPYAITNDQQGAKTAVVKLDFGKKIIARGITILFSLGKSPAQVNGGSVSTITISASSDGSTYTDLETISNTTTETNFTKTYTFQTLRSIKITHNSTCGAFQCSRFILKSLNIKLDSIQYLR